MGWFSGTPRVQRRLRELEDRCDATDRQLKLIRAEWDDTYDKIRVAMGRVVKRAAYIESTEKDRPAAEPAAPEPSFNGRMLDDRQRTIQHDILRRRAGL